MQGKWLIVCCLALTAAACESPVIPSSPSSSPDVAAANGSIGIPIGQSARVTVGLNDLTRFSVDPRFEAEGWADYRFRVVNVMASEPGTVILRVVSDEETDARPAGWRVRNITCCSSWSWQSIHQVTLTIPAAGNLEVELRIPVNGPAETFTVSTSRVDQ